MFTIDQVCGLQLLLGSLSSALNPEFGGKPRAIKAGPVDLLDLLDVLRPVYILYVHVCDVFMPSCRVDAQVRSIVARALQDKEAELTDRYDHILADRLTG